ncbi:MAG: radical SAM protein, partial [Chloroflexi bacterium]|nr:radical SAM protein [Chloroflexota bacterium]
TGSRCAAPDMLDMIVREITCKSALTRSGIGGVDYALNPYVGCQHGCAYCYAVFMKRFTGHREEWGQFVDVRVNAPQALAKQLKRAKPGTVSLGTVTDAYQPLEGQYQLSRQCLQALVAYPDFPTTVLTKSALVLRDVDILCEMKDVEVAFTITTLDDSVRRVLEPRASPIPQRIEALARLHDAGISTWAFFGPALPVFSDSEEAINAFFAAVAQTGVSRILVDTLNLTSASWGRLQPILEKHYPEVVDTYRLIWQDRHGYATALAKRVARVAERYHVPYELCF